MSMFIRRLRGWDSNSWKHLINLFKSMLHGFWMGDISEIIDAYWWIKFHLSYDSKLVYLPKIRANNCEKGCDK